MSERRQETEGTEKPLKEELEGGEGGGQGQQGREGVLRDGLLPILIVVTGGGVDCCWLLQVQGYVCSLDLARVSSVPLLPLTSPHLTCHEWKTEKKEREHLFIVVVVISVCRKGWPSNLIQFSVMVLLSSCY